MKKIFSLFAAVLFVGSMMAGTYKLTNANIVAAGAGESGYKAWTVQDDASREWNAYAIKNQHSKATSQYHFLQIKKYASEVAYYVQIPELGGETISSIKMTVSNANKPMSDGGNTATVFFSASNATSAAGEGVVSGTGDAEITLDVADLNLKTGYITAGAAVRIWEIEVTTGAAPAVVAPAIAGEAEFFDSTEVSITCATEGAAIYYTLDGTDPTASSTQYTAAFKLNATTTVKAIAIKGEDKSKIAEKVFTAKPSYASIEALVAADLADGTLVKVAFEDVKIDSVFTIKAGNRRGIYVNVKDKTGEKDVEIYYGKDDVPAAWEAEGKVSGTIIGTWTYYSNSKVWEIIPSGDDWKWTSLTYVAPSATAISNTAVEGKAVKTITNGMLIIEKNGVKYNVMGQAIR